MRRPDHAEPPATDPPRAGDGGGGGSTLDPAAVTEPSLGAGEIFAGPTAAAIANAVADAVGVRVRDMPITADAIVAAIRAG